MPLRALTHALWYEQSLPVLDAPVLLEVEGCLTSSERQELESQLSYLVQFRTALSKTPAEFQCYGLGRGARAASARNSGWPVLAL